jgi:hypothetical protein
MSSTPTGIWQEQQIILDGVIGFHVEAVDGRIGKVDEASVLTDSRHVIVDIGHWILGKKVLLPIGVIDRIDRDNETVYVNRTKQQIKESPRFRAPETNVDDDAYLL